MNEAYLFNLGENYEAYKYFGSFRKDKGFIFRVYAPNARSVRVAGDFNAWNFSSHFMNRAENTGVFELYIEEAKVWDRYKYIVETQSGEIVEKADPFARHAELRPETASIIYESETNFEFTDEDFILKRDSISGKEVKPLNIYECHLGSWRKYKDGNYYNYRDLAIQLADYLLEMSYTAIEILPITEYPLDDSWGYQVSGYFAPSSRYGTPDDFKFFVNHMHSKGIRVILDWVPGHFPKDSFGLARFDGTACYEYADPRIGEHEQWGTLVFDYSKTEVQSFLLSSAWFWFEEFHIDGIRVDAVSSMLYLNFARTEFLKNKYGGSENLEAIEFLRRLNGLIRSQKQGALMIAEEATTFPSITKEISEGGLGFTHKWNMGWMHDSLDYMKYDYYARGSQHNKLTFSLTYAFSENYVLPFSHDEVVHGKKSLIGRMPGDIWRQCASLRNLFVWQAAHPGAILNFMGNEFGQFIEWRFYEELEWFMLSHSQHQAIQNFVKHLNKLYKDEKAFWENDDNWEGFHWLEADDAWNSVYIFERRAKNTEDRLLFIFNMTPAVVRNYQIYPGRYGKYEIILNSDSEQFGGSSYQISQANGLYLCTEPASISEKDRILSERQLDYEEKYKSLVNKRKRFMKLRDELLETYHEIEKLSDGDMHISEDLPDIFNTDLPLPDKVKFTAEPAKLTLDLPPLSSLILKLKDKEDSESI